MYFNSYKKIFTEKERLTAWSQTNASEVERPRVWAARSVLELGATRSAHGRQLACRAHHPSYPSPYYRDAYTMLDVTCMYYKITFTPKQGNSMLVKKFVPESNSDQ